MEKNWIDYLHKFVNINVNYILPCRCLLGAMIYVRTEKLCQSR